MKSPISHSVDKSKKSFGVAVCLCGVFGVLGVHHFYIGNWLHGIIDFSLLVIAILFFAAGTNGSIALGSVVFLVDVMHTIFVFYKLIVGKQIDGSGKLISWQ